MVFAALIVTFGLAAGITAFLVRPVAHLCNRKDWIARPDPRRVHQVPTPTLGGLAIVSGFVLALLFTFLLEQTDPLLQRTSFEHLRLVLLLTGTFVVATVSFLDDIRSLSPGLRLTIHFVAASIAIGPYLWDHTLYPDIMGMPTEARGIILTAFNVPYFDQIHLHHITPWLAILVTMVWIAGIQNMLNWVDGLDGLAAGVTLIAAIILALHALLLGQWTVALLPIALAGACAGFLPFNFHPAHIFMGDVGAMSLGYVLAVSAIIGGAKLATALLVLGIPLIDMTWLIFWRAFHRRSVATSGRDNLHIRLIDMGFSQRQVVGFYYVVSAAFGAIALLDVMTPMTKLVAICAMGLVVLTVVFYAVSKQQA
jgi:UDP-N-acetylmuramyl pentapeptide phosphotransferase/UDP-N-acetylglucosamine-1-phosphate transferase